VATELCGVDISARALEEVGETRDNESLVVGDIQQLGKLELGRRYEVAMVSEVLEHLDNPGLCLQGVKSVLEPNGILVLSVPSALGIRVFANALLGRERVQQDHRSWYSPRTLGRLLESCGYQLVDMFPYWGRPRVGFAGLLDRLLALSGLISPWLGEGLVACARPGVLQRPARE
jgi:predicted TPR repeat methyltransferase